jgi:hypothetical protein
MFAVKNPTRAGACLVMGLSIIIVLSMPCAAGPGGRSDGTGAPLCAMTSPANGSLARGTVEVRGTAVKGSLPLTAVLVRVDGGAWKHADGLENWTLTVDTTLLEDGEHTIYARASDAIQSSENASVRILVRDPGRPVSSGFDPMCLVMVIITAGMVASVVLAALARRRM